MTTTNIESKIKSTDVDLRREQGGDDPVYQAYVNGAYEGTVCKGWTRVGGQGWVVIRRNEASSLTKRNLDDCRRYIADQPEGGAAMTPQQRKEIERDPLAWLITAVGGTSNPRPPALQPYATLEEAKAAGPKGSRIRLNAIKTYLRAQAEAKRQAKAVRQ